jgi:hypothetical protein
MRNTSSTRSATTAIAALLALTSAPALSQEAATPPLDGPIVNPQPVPVSQAPEPVIVLPDFATPVAEPAPEAEPAPAAEEAAPPARAATSQRAPAARTATTEPAPVAAPVPDPVSDAELPTEEAATPMAVAPLAAEPIEPVAPAPAADENMTAVLALVLVALLGLIGAIFAFAALRRRHPATAARKAARAPEPAARPVASVAEPAPEPAFDRDSVPAQPTARPLSSRGAAVPLPARLPDSYEERDALLQRMIDAPPDRANPFTDRRARLRRARLILQSLGRTFENATPWIDLSDNPENWPALAHRRADARAAFEPAPVREYEAA